VGLLTLCLLLGALEGCGGASARSDAGSRKHVTASPKLREPPRTVGEFGHQGTDAAGLQEPFGIAVDQHNGDVYVVDSNHFRVEKFTSTGRFLLAWGWGVADGRTHKLQTCTRTCFAGVAGGGAGQFFFPEGVAVDNNPSSASYRDVYVVDLHNSFVSKFTRRGEFLLTFGGGVNRTAHRHHEHSREDVCPLNPGDVCGMGFEGATGAQLEFHVECSCIAVAPDGSVWVGQRNRVKVFSPEGVYRSQIKLVPDPEPAEGREFGGVSGLAINGSGELYVIRHNIVGVNEYAPSGELLRTLEPHGEPAYPEGPNPSLALDPAGNVFIDVYANYTHRIDEFNASGTKIASFDKGQKAPPAIADKEDGLPGMAYNARTGNLYLVNADVNVRPIVERVRIVKPPQPTPLQSG
jgi:hypothetical protein